MRKEERKAWHTPKPKFSQQQIPNLAVVGRACIRQHVSPICEAHQLVAQ
jgi:hypothetical protein